MLNIKLKNLFIVIFLLFSLTLTYGCSKIPGLSEKPSEETIKGIILSIEGERIKVYESYFKNFTFEEFQIANEFNKKTNNGNVYYIEVDYVGKYLVKDYNGTRYRYICSSGCELCSDRLWKNGVGNNRYSFVKRGTKWYGQRGWVE